jgi:hypothetical protein
MVVPVLASATPSAKSGSPPRAQSSSPKFTVASFKTEGSDSMSTVAGGRFMGTPFDAMRSSVSLT